MFLSKNFLQSDHGLSPCRSTVKILRAVLCTAVGLLVFNLPPVKAQAQNCTSTYEPGSPQQRLNSGLWDGRVGPVKVVNNTENAIIISLYHPDAPERIFKYWFAEPGQSFLLSTDNYSSDWGIQVDEGPICFVGRVASWDSRMFTTFPSRLFITDSTLSTNLDAAKSQAAVVRTFPALQRPETYEAIATKQISQGQQRSGLISLLRAADLYRASGRSKDEQRVRDRIKHEIRGS